MVCCYGQIIHWWKLQFSQLVQINTQTEVIETWLDLRYIDFQLIKTRKLDKLEETLPKVQSYLSVNVTVEYMIVCLGNSFTLEEYFYPPLRLID